MLTVPEAAIRAGRNPETIRRWVREGRLRSLRVGTQHFIEETDLAEVADGPANPALRAGWETTVEGDPMPNWTAIVRSVRDAR